MTAPNAVRETTRLRSIAVAVLAVPGVAGAVLSWESMRAAAAGVFGPRLAVAFPALVDALALGAALRWVASVRDGTPISGWRVTAHAAVGGSILLNALAAHTPGEVPWHVTAPAVWSALVELFARDMAGHHRRDVPAVPRDAIPLRLWLTVPGESVQTWLRQARTGQTSAIAARLDADRIAAAGVAVRTALPGRRHRRARREILRRLGAGTLSPARVPGVLGWSAAPDSAEPDPGRAAVRAALWAALDPDPRSPIESIRSDHGVDPIDPIQSRRSAPRSAPVDPTSASIRLDRSAAPARHPIDLVASGQDPLSDRLDRPDRRWSSSPEDVPTGEHGPPDGRSAAKADGLDAGPVGGRAGRVAAARPADVAALAAAVTAGHLPPRPSVEAVRAHLRISPAHARSARAALLAADAAP